MTNTLIVDPDKCTSCRLCELVCSERRLGAYRPSRTGIRVAIDADQAFYFPMVCIQCEDAPCIDACPVHALVRDPGTNAVVVVAEKCDACGLCEPACPYGAIRCLDGQALKCDLCGGDPECVRFCAPGALRYESPESWPQKQRQAYTERLRELRQEVKA
jgi:carbon-monoxide dehydrogenase iron sulfur subunit